MRIPIVAGLVVAWLVLSGAANAYYVEYDDGTRQDVVCEQNGGQVGVQDADFPFAWDPLCVEIQTGESVTWTANGQFAHAPGSELDAAECFLATRDRQPVNQGIPAGESWEVFFRFFPLEGVEASVDGGQTWRDCDLVLDIEQSTVEVAVVPYLCVFHPEMQGLIAIRSSVL